VGIGAIATVQNTHGELAHSTVGCSASLQSEVGRQDHLSWYAAYTRSRHEMFVSRQMQERLFENFLPTYHSIRRWKDREKELDLPLFPGYVFVRIAGPDRTRVLQIPGVVRFVGFQMGPVPLANDEIEALRNGIMNGIRAEPHPFLRVGQRVRVKHGPLAGTQGILLRKKGQFKLVISLDLIMRAVVVEVQAADLE
jgi:transcription antitermination factor NusG